MGQFSLGDAMAHAEKHGYTLGVFAGKGMAAQQAVDNVIAAAAAAPKMRSSKQPNKTEAEFGRILQARIDKGELRGPLQFEGVKLRIGGNCYYTPDWFARSYYGGPTFFEVKGAHIWDDSKVKFKAAAEQHTWARFEMWQKVKGDWSRIL